MRPQSLSTFLFTASDPSFCVHVLTARTTRYSWRQERQSLIAVATKCLSAANTFIRGVSGSIRMLVVCLPACLSKAAHTKTRFHHFPCAAFILLMLCGTLHVAFASGAASVCLGAPAGCCHCAATAWQPDGCWARMKLNHLLCAVAWQGLYSVRCVGGCCSSITTSRPRPKYPSRLYLSA